MSGGRGNNTFVSRSMQQINNLAQNATVAAHNIGDMAKDAAAVAARVLAVIAVFVLLLVVITATATTAATSFSILVRAWVLWGIPSDADIPLTFDFSHGAQRCGSPSSPACALATSILDVRYGVLSAAESHSGYDETFTEPAFNFVPGARYSLTLDMKVPESAACLGMMTVQTELFVSSAGRKTLSSKSVFTTASSSAVGPAPREQEPWLTRKVRELFWLPIAVFVPHFDAVPPKPLLPVHFELMSRFAPPRSVADSIRYFNVSLFASPTGGGGLPCCPSKGETAAECLRIYEPVMKVRVHVTGLLARLHQAYPITSFAVIFGPTWLVVFAGSGALLFGGAAYLSGWF